MRGPHGQELRQRAVKVYEEGELGYQAVAELFGVGIASLRRWVRIYRESGRLHPLRKGGGTPSAVSEDELAGILRAHPDATAVEITAAYNKRRRGRSRVHPSTIKRALHRFGYVPKKSESVRLNNCARTWCKNGKRTSGR